MYTDVRGLSGLLARSCEALLIALPLAVIAWWIAADAATLAAAANLPPLHVLSPEPWPRVAGAGISLLSVAFLLASLWQARSFFRLFTAGQVFTADAVRCLPRFAGWVALSVVARVVAG